MKYRQFLKDFELIQNFYEIPNSIKNVFISLFYKNLSKSEKALYSEVINHLISTTSYQKTLVDFINKEHLNNKLRENKT